MRSVSVPTEKRVRLRPIASRAVDVADRIAGSVLGLALGDAVGAPFEGRRAADVPDPLLALELPWMSLPPGSTTDDTAMARNLVRSLAAGGELDPDDLVARHLEWYRSGPPDVGAFTRRVLSRVDRGEDAFEAARSVWEERGPEVSAGNGSVMYCAPLGLAYAGRPDELIEVAPRLSALTHFDERCGTAVLAVTLTVASLTRGQSPEGALATGLAAVVDREGGEELEYLVEIAGVGRQIDGPDQGFCLFTAGVALQSLLGTGDFEVEVRRVVALGGDTDTNAAVAGALLGALVGEAGLPPAWLDRLRDRTAIRAEALGLVTPARRSNRSPEG
jgi:ADP-ribosyl-[dinitrogen reductase] hydrolase